MSTSPAIIRHASSICPPKKPSQHACTTFQYAKPPHECELSGQNKLSLVAPLFSQPIVNENFSGQSSKSQLDSHHQSAALAASGQTDCYSHSVPAGFRTVQSSPGQSEPGTAAVAYQ